MPRELIRQVSGELLGRRDDGLTWFRASTDAIDRHGTIVKPGGLDLANFKKNPVFLWGHDGYAVPDIQNTLGIVADVEQTRKRLDVGVKWAPHERAQLAEKLVDGKFLRATSIGFYPDYDSITVEEMEGGKRVPVYHRGELLEVSLVTIPANPEAVKALDAGLRSILPDPQGAQPADDREGEAAPSDQGADIAALYRGLRDTIAARRLLAAWDARG
jgi:HK97 family phage prohead protease